MRWVRSSPFAGESGGLTCTVVVLEVGGAAELVGHHFSELLDFDHLRNVHIHLLMHAA